MGQSVGHYSDLPEGAVVYSDIPEGATLAHDPATAGTMDYKRETARLTFNANQPQSTIATRGQAVGEGLYGGVKDFLLGAVDFGKKVASMDPSQQADALASIPGGIYHAIVNAPSAYIDAMKSGDYDEAARQAGRITTTTLPAVYGISKAVVPLANAGTSGVLSRLDPTEMQAKANALREAAAAKPLNGSIIDVTKPGTALTAINRLSMPARAAAYEGLARAVDARYSTQPGGFAYGPEAYEGTGESVASPQSAGGTAQASRVSQAQASQLTPMTKAQALAPKLNIPRPGVPLPAAVDLAARQAEMDNSPLNLETKPPSAPSQEIPFTAPESFGELKGKPVSALTPAEVNKWMGVPARDVMHGANPGQQILTEKLLGMTKEATKANVDSALGQSGAQLEAQLRASGDKGVTVDAQTPLYDAYASTVKRIGSPRDSTFTAQTQGIVDDIEAKYPNLDKLAPIDAHALKVELGKSIDWGNSDNPVNHMMKQIYRSVNDSLTKSDPSIGPTQTRWGNLYVASRNLASGIAKDAVGKGTGPKPTQKFGFGLTQP